MRTIAPSTNRADHRPASGSIPGVACCCSTRTRRCEPVRMRVLKPHATQSVGSAEQGCSIPTSLRRPIRIHPSKRLYFPNKSSFPYQGKVSRLLTVVARRAKTLAETEGFSASPEPIGLVSPHAPQTRLGQPIPDVACCFSTRTRRCQPTDLEAYAEAARDALR